MFNNLFPENRAVYKIMSKNIVETDRSQMPKYYGAWNLHCSRIKATDPHSELTAFAGNNGYTNARQYYITRTLPLPLKFSPLLGLLSVLLCLRLKTCHVL